MDMQSLNKCPICNTDRIGLKCPTCGYEFRNYPNECRSLMDGIESQRQETHRQWFENLSLRVDRVNDNSNSNTAYLILVNFKLMIRPIKVYRLFEGRTSFGKARTKSSDPHFEKIDAHYYIDDKQLEDYHFSIQFFRRNESKVFKIQVISPNVVVRMRGVNLQYEGTSYAISQEDRIRFDDYEAWITTGEIAIK